MNLRTELIVELNAFNFEMKIVGTYKKIVVTVFDIFVVLKNNKLVKPCVKFVIC